MALLAFELPKLGAVPSSAVSASPSKKGKAKEVESPALPASLSALLLPAQRQRTAAAVNAAILRSQSHGSEPKLPNLLKMLAYGEDLLQSKVVSFPRLDMSDLLSKAKSNGIVAANGDTGVADMEL